MGQVVVLFHQGKDSRRMIAKTLARTRYQRGAAALLWMAAGIAGVCCPIAMARAQADAAPTPSATRTQDSALTAAQRVTLARTSGRAALLFLRSQPNPTSADFRLASALLERASDLDPTQTQLVRRWIDAADAAGDQAALERASRRLIQLDPSDTVAQLRLITTRIATIQVAPQRLASLERLARPARGERALDASIRSRLALDAALLAREVGDEDKFLDLLTLATQLDSTNKDAAFLAVSVGLAAGVTPTQHAELLSNLLLADPLDAQSHLRMRDLLASVGAFGPAQRFHNVALAISQAQTAGAQLEVASTLRETLCLRWHIEGPQVVTQELGKELASARYRQQQLFDRVNPTNLEELRRPEDLRLSLPAEELRLAAAIAQGEAGAVGESLSDLGKTLAEFERALSRPDNPDPAGAAELVREARGSSLLWALLANLGLDAVRPQRKAIIEAMAGDDRLASIEAWLLLRLGPPEDQPGLTPQAFFRERAVRGEADDAWMRLALAQFLESSGQPAEAKSIYRELALAQPMSALGCLAAQSARRLSDGALEHPDRAGVERVARAVPSWVDGMVASPFLTQRIEIAAVPATTRSTDEARFDVTLRSISGVPLALGAGAPIDATLFVGAMSDLGTRGPLTALVGEVVSAASRLRLNPGDRLTIPLTLDELGWSWQVGTASATPTTLRLRVLQGMITDAQGQRRPGPGSLDAGSPTMTIAANPAARLSLDDLLTTLASAPALSRDVMIACRAAILGASPAGRDANNAPNPQAAARIDEALAQHYASWPLALRLFALTELPHAREAPLPRFTQALAQSERNADALALALLTRSADAPSARALLDAVRSEPQLASALALVVSAVEARLGSEPAAPGQ